MSLGTGLRLGALSPLVPLPPAPRRSAWPAWWRGKSNPRWPWRCRDLPVLPEAGVLLTAPPTLASL